MRKRSVKKRSIRIDGDTAYVPLTQGKEAIIDVSLVRDVGAHNWRVHKKSCTYYAQRSFRKTNGVQTVEQMHRFIWEYEYGSIPDDMEIDHINGNGLDNRLQNLRIVTHHQNQQNRIEHRNGHLVGTQRHKQTFKWQARVQINRKRLSLGLFDTQQEAHVAYQTALAQIEEEIAHG